MKKRTMIFPYDLSLFHMINYKDNMEKYEITDVVSFRSWGLCGKDAGANLGLRTGMLVSDNFIQSMENVDAVMLADSNISVDSKVMTEYIEKASQAGKEIVDIRKVAWQVSNKEFITDGQNNGLLQLKEPTVPIVFVLGTGENTGKFDIQLYVRKMFLNEGYTVSQIGSKNYCELFGFHSFPEFMSAPYTAQQIILFNHYLNRIINKENPDVVIVGVPGGVLPLSDKLLDDFGLLNFLISNAVTPDYVILNTGYVSYNREYILSMVDGIRQKFGYEVDSVFLSNYMINWEATDSLDRLCYITLPVDIVNETAKNCNCYTIFNQESMEKFSKKMLTTLMQYSDFETV